ncbi:hypothetical protein PFISCL1PPCAC_10119, partial [Pristionchus fissidentatus]
RMGKRKLPVEDTVEEEEIDEKVAKTDIIDEFTHFVSSPLTTKDVESIKKRTRKGVKLSLPGLPPASYAGGVTDSLSPMGEVTSLDSLGYTEKLMVNMKEFMEKEEYDEEKMDKYESMMSLMGKYVDMNMLIDDEKKKMHKIGYCTHALNHVIRTRNTVLKNKQRLEKATAKGEVGEDLVESLRDQGFVRPTVLILLPYRRDVHRLLEIVKNLMFGAGAGKKDILNKERFEEEFGQGMTKTYERLKEDEEDDGNRDDCFRLGVALSRKSLKLYTPFDKSDILICSPIGLRMIIGGDSGKESHLLASMQLVVVDEADILLQQNWEHLPLIFSTLHSPPNKINTDVSRVRTQYLDGFASCLSQTLLFSAHRHELFTALSMGNSNHRGMISFRPPSEGLLTQIELRLCQELHSIKCDDPASQSDARFNFFKEKICPTLSMHTAIFISSYYDYVRVRNQMKKDTESFVQCHEYAPLNKITRARDLFYHGEKKLMLITERFHHFNRVNIRKMQKIVFYQPPSRPSFYIDLINMCQPEGRLQSTLLFTQYDRIRMENIFGLEMGTAILKSEKAIQAIVSE